MTTIVAVVIASAVALALWIEQRLKRLSDGTRIRVFLTVISRESEEIYGVAVPLRRENLVRDLTLQALPSPGCELDGLGAGPCVIARVVLEPGAQVAAYIQLHACATDEAALDDFLSGLVGLGWRRLPIEIPYPAPGPDNSSKRTPLRGAA